MKKIVFCFLMVAPFVAAAQKRVGIGTATPAQRLSIDSTVNIDQGNFDDGGKPSLRFGDGASGEAIGSRRISGGNNPFGLDFWTGSNKRMVISNAGNVGIGTDVPQGALSVNGDVLVDFNSTNNGVTGYSLRFGNASSGEGIASARSGSINLNGLNLFTNFIPRLSITSNGKVGIGTTNPLVALHTIGISGDQIITYAEGSNATFASSYINSTTATAYVGNGMQRQGVTRGYIGINPTNDLILARVEPAFGLHTALTVLNNTGNIGIGTSTPAQRLSIDSTLNVDQGNYDDGTKPALRFGDASTGEAIGSRRAASGTNPYGLDFWTGNAKRMVLSNAGYLGIGETSPGYPLNFSSTLGDKISLYGNSGNHYGFGIQDHLMQIYNENSTSDIAFGTGSSASFTENVRFKGDGKVGVGLSSPLARMHVKGITGDQIIFLAEGDNSSFVSSYINSTSSSAYTGYGMLRQNVVRGYTGINPNNDLILARVRPVQGLEAAVTVANATGYVGVGTTTPAFPLDVFDAANLGFIAMFSSNNSSNSILQINNNASGTNVSNIGVGMYRNGIAKAYLLVNGNNNFICSANGSEQVILTPAGNLGIAQSNPGFPLNFASATGEKIALYGNSGNNYGIGIQNLLMQLHTDVAGADIAFGYGSSASFNETMRIKGNGNLSVKGDIITDINGTNNGLVSPGLRFGASNSGEAISSKRTAGGNQNGLDLYTNGAARISIDNSGLVGINGNTTPGARLQVNQTGNYNTSEGSTHAFEIWDNNETLYMGADGGNSISYIQAVGNSTFHTLALQARGGNIAIGKSSAAEKIDVNGNGAFSGNVSVQSGKGIVRNYTGTQLKTEMIPFTFPGLVTLNAGNTTTLSVTFPEAYTAAPMVYVAGLVPSSGSGGHLECVYNVSGITTTGFILSIYNPRSTGATFNNGSPNFAINFVATGAQ